MTYAPLHDDSTRTNPVGMSRYADQFLEAAFAAFKPREDSWPLNDIATPPVMFLIGQSIELSLKAFLLSKGVTLRQIRSKDYGHSLQASLKKAKELGLLSLLDLSQDERVALVALDNLYATKQLQYIVTGVKQLPSYELIVLIATKLLQCISREVGYKPKSIPDAA